MTFGVVKDDLPLLPRHTHDVFPGELPARSPRERRRHAGQSFQRIILPQHVVQQIAIVWPSLLVAAHRRFAGRCRRSIDAGILLADVGPVRNAAQPHGSIPMQIVHRLAG